MRRLIALIMIWLATMRLQRLRRRFLVVAIGGDAREIDGDDDVGLAGEQIAKQRIDETAINDEALRARRGAHEAGDRH
jgi:hypothetical protein